MLNNQQQTQKKSNKLAQKIVVFNERRGELLHETFVNAVAQKKYKITLIREVCCRRKLSSECNTKIFVKMLQFLLFNCYTNKMFCYDRRKTKPTTNFDL